LSVQQCWVGLHSLVVAAGKHLHALVSAAVSLGVHAVGAAVKLHVLPTRQNLPAVHSFVVRLLLHLQAVVMAATSLAVQSV